MVLHMHSTVRAAAHARPPLERATMVAGHVDLGPGLVDEGQAGRIERALALSPHLPALENVRSILLARAACLHFARHPVADEEALDRAIAEVEPTPGEQAARLFDGTARSLSEQVEDQRTMRFDANGATVSAQHSRTRIALDVRPWHASSHGAGQSEE